MSYEEIYVFNIQQSLPFLFTLDVYIIDGSREGGGAKVAYEIIDY